MSNPVHTTIATGGLARVPNRVIFTEIGDQTTRAVMVAHLIRTGDRPAVGLELGFSSQLKQAEADDVNGIDPFTCEPVGEKTWHKITVTQADIDAAHALINEQKLNYRNPEISQLI